MVGDEAGHVGGDEAHGIPHCIDDAHQGPSKVVPNICSEKKYSNSFGDFEAIGIYC
jgi:hypothetical protein